MRNAWQREDGRERGLTPVLNNVIEKGRREKLTASHRHEHDERLRDSHARQSVCHIRAKSAIPLCDRLLTRFAGAANPRLPSWSLNGLAPCRSVMNGSGKDSMGTVGAWINPNASAQAGRRRQAGRCGFYRQVACDYLPCHEGQMGRLRRMAPTIITVARHGENLLNRRISCYAKSSGFTNHHSGRTEGLGE